MPGGGILMAKTELLTTFSRSIDSDDWILKIIFWVEYHSEGAFLSYWLSFSSSVRAHIVYEQMQAVEICNIFSTVSLWENVATQRSFLSLLIVKVSDGSNKTYF